jgi:hypothetical protein
MRVLEPQQKIEFFCKRLCGGSTITDPTSSIFIPKLVELGIPFLKDENKHVRHEIGQTLIIIVTVISAEMDQTPIVSKRRDKESLKVKIRDYYQKLERLNNHFPRTGPRYSFSMSSDSNKSQSQIKGGKIYIEGPTWNDDVLSDLDETTDINNRNSESSHEFLPLKQKEQSLSMDASPIMPGIADNSRHMKQASSDIAVILYD